MINNKNIAKILSILEREIERYQIPVVEKISNLHKSDFHILVATILSARTKDEVTEKASKKLFRTVKCAADLLRLDKNEIERLIFPVGFYKVKAENLKRLAKVLVTQYNNKVPDNLDELLKLPGVGRKTANLVLIEAFNKDGICVDTHVHRITNRWGYVTTKTPDETEMALRAKLPKKFWKRINKILVVYGKNVCKPLNPNCTICKIKNYCQYGIAKL